MGSLITTIIKDKLEAFKFNLTFELENEKIFDKKVISEIANLKSNNDMNCHALSVVQKMSFYLPNTDNEMLGTFDVEDILRAGMTPEFISEYSISIFSEKRLIPTTGREELAFKDLLIHFRVINIPLTEKDEGEISEPTNEIMPLFYYLLLAVPWAYDEFMELVRYMDEKNHLPYLIDKQEWFLSDILDYRESVYKIAKLNMNSEPGLLLWLEMQ